MSPSAGTLTVRLADMPEVLATLEAAAAEIARLKAEVEELEDRYDWLLSQVGGTAP